MRHALLEDRELGIARRVDQRQRELRGERVGDVALRHHAQRHQQRAQPLARLLLEAQGALERGRVELAALDQDLAQPLANRWCPRRKGFELFKEKLRTFYHRASGAKARKAL